MITHQQIKFIHSLKMKKNRSDFFVVEGEKMVSELINSDYEIEAIYHTSDVNISHSKSEHVSSKEMDRMSHFKSASSILALVKKPLSIRQLDESKLQIILDDIRDPGNLGTIIRIADWFGIDAVFCSENSVDVYNSKTIQSSMGSIFRVAVSYIDIEKELQHFNSPIIGTVLDGENLYETTLPKSGIILIGSESHGISSNVKSLLSHSVKIPQFGKAESLNAAVACGIICSEIKRS